MAYLADRQVKKAIELLEHVVSLDAKALAEDDPSRLDSQHELARAYRGDGQVKKAIELFEHVASVRKTLAVNTEYHFQGSRSEEPVECLQVKVLLLWLLRSGLKREGKVSTLKGEMGVANFIDNYLRTAEPTVAWQDNTCSREVQNVYMRGQYLTSRTGFYSLPTAKSPAALVKRCLKPVSLSRQNRCRIALSPLAGRPMTGFFQF
jgi:hypothetical protein